MKSNHRRIRRASRLGASLAVLTAAATLTAPGSASATPTTTTTTGVPAPYVTTSNNVNGSDPHPVACTLPNGTQGYCLFTSQDLNQSGTTANPYPVNQAIGYFSTDGITWTNGNGGGAGSGKVVTTEQNYRNAGWGVPSGANHLWSPDAAKGSDGNWYLYAPDITNLSHPNTSSFIGISKSSTGPLGSYVTDRKLVLPANARASNGQLVAEPNSGYAGDPDVFTDSFGHNWVAWANGDGSNCGGISLAQLRDGSMDTFASGAVTQGVDIQGIPSDWDASSGNDRACSDSLGLHHLYERGPHIYNTSTWGADVPGPYVLVASIKPADNAAGPQSNICANSVQSQPGTNNQIIVYATASSPQGPYIYGGPLMCGSQTQLTDQAGLLLVSSHGRNAMVMIYHDGPGNTSTPGQHRTLHAECLMYGSGAIANAIRTGGMTNRQSGAIANCLNNPFMTETVGFKSSTTNMYVSSNGTSTGSTLQANREQTGPLEQFIIAVDGAGIDPTVYNSSGQFVSTQVDAVAAQQLVATDDTPGANFLDVGADSYDPPDPTQFNAVIGNGYISLYSVSTDKFIVTDTTAGEDYLAAEVSPPGNGEAFLIYHY